MNSVYGLSTTAHVSTSGHADDLSNTAALVLAGGRSRRFRADKRMARFKEGTLLGNALDKASAVARTVYLSLSGNDEAVDRFLEERPVAGSTPPVFTVSDHFEGCGPLAGIHAGLLESGASFLLVIAHDMPMISLETLARLVKSAHGSRGARIVLARSLDGMEQPLAGVYTADLCPILESRLRNGQYGVGEFLTHVRANFGNRSVLCITVPEKELLNVNYPGDLPGPRESSS